MWSLIIPTNKREEMVDITSLVDNLLADATEDGVCHVFVPHTTAGITINENADPDVERDLLAGWDAMVPQLAYRHREGNARAHIKASLIGSAVLVPVRNGRLQLGTWQALYLCEFDGPRQRQVWVELLPRRTETGQ